MKSLFIIIIPVLMCLFNCQNNSHDADNERNELQKSEPKPILLVLPGSLENRRQEFLAYINSAQNNIKQFAKKHGWEKLTEESFMDSVLIFDDKKAFNITLLKLAEADTTVELPDTYCAALEKRTLISMSPEFYSKVFPQGVEKQSFEKLLTHEIAHRLHVRILNGNEEAMGPIWFYEGFAIYAADQFLESPSTIGKEEMTNIMQNPDRGSYLKYNYIFRYFANKLPLKELISKAKNEDFNQELILLLN